MNITPELEVAREIAEALTGEPLPEPQNEAEAALELFVLMNECFNCGANMEGEETCWDCGFEVEF